MEVKRTGENEWTVKCPGLELEVKIQAKDLTDAIARLRGFASYINFENITKADLDNRWP